MLARKLSLLPSQNARSGFTLIELIIVIAIVGILAAVAVPQYNQYVFRAKFTELVSASSSIKSTISNCYEITSGADACNVSSPNQTVPGQVTDKILERAANGSLIDSIALIGATTPIIEVTAIMGEKLDGKTYVLTGVATGTAGIDRSIVEWIPSGTGCDAGWC